MPTCKPRGLRCSICGDLVGGTTNWLIVTLRKGYPELFCSECADDLFACLQTYLEDWALKGSIEAAWIKEDLEHEIGSKDQP